MLELQLLKIKYENEIQVYKCSKSNMEMKFRYRIQALKIKNENEIWVYTCYHSKSNVKIET